MLLAGEIDAPIGLPGLDMTKVRTVIPDAETAAVRRCIKKSVPFHFLGCGGGGGGCDMLGFTRHKEGRVPCG